VTDDDLFEISTEVFIKRDSGAALLRIAQDFSNGPSATARRPNHRDRLMIAIFDNHLGSQPDFFKNRVCIAGEIGLGDSLRPQAVNDSAVCLAAR